MTAKRVKNEAPDRQKPKRRSKTGEASEAWRDVVRQSVELGNDVVEEQLALGKDVAHRLNRQISTASGRTSDVQNITESLFEACSEVSTRWFDLLAAMAGGQRPVPRSSEAASGELRKGVSVLVESSVPTPVQVDIDHNAVGLKLVADPAMCPDTDFPPLKVGITPATAEQSLEVTVHVPDGQPAGEYQAAVRTGEVSVGTIVIEVPASGA